ncbi:response regulator [Motiliproteus coralliicola]|uniref:Response regulator n=1 Tax=Motiliproteus coralliicola TaxID=2283196 RepID=A0A369WWB1_9GAMM|nr:response regulator [Motiliproteus coralliicola]RDE24836.1 response regulator [Motiliproteus coralliicola]
MTPWKVLIVDDEEGIHGITRMIFRGYEFEKRPIKLISAMSGAQARELLQQHPDIAVALLDVVMETDHEGLQLVNHIRAELDNPDMRVILRTGHPGYAPEAQVIVNYDINDYLSKAELSASRLLTSVVVALRSFRDIKTARQQQDPQAEPQTTGQLAADTTKLLQTQIEPIVKQGRRLQSLELNPVAHDLSGELHARHQRLANTITLLDSHPLSANQEALTLAPLLDSVLKVFLPLSRQQGWLLDYRIGEQVPSQIQSDPELLQRLLLGAIELVARQANGSDLKLSLDGNQETGKLIVEIAPTDGQPTLGHDDWVNHLRGQLDRLCDALQGQLLEAGDEGVVRFSLLG